MDWLETWWTSLERAFNRVVVDIASFLPNLVIALIILVIGILVASFIGGLVKKLLLKANVDTVVENLGIRRGFREAGVDLHIANFVGWAVKWFILIIFFVAIADVLNLPQISDFVNEIALYIPNVIAAAAILAIGIVVANLLSKIVFNATEAADFDGSGLVSSIVQWSILAFTFLAALAQLQIATNMIQILFTGIVVALALAIGLAFGLGGQDSARQMIQNAISKANRGANVSPRATTTTAAGKGRTRR